MVELDPIWIDWPISRIRRDLDVDDGRVSRFVVQLEYDVAAVAGNPERPDWRVVARFDHDATSGGGHDVASEGSISTSIATENGMPASAVSPTSRSVERCDTVRATSRTTATDCSRASRRGTTSTATESGSLVSNGFAS